MLGKTISRVFGLLFTTVVLCFYTLGISAQSSVHVETAGTLAQLLPTSESELTVTGSINGSDIKHLRQLTNKGGVTSIDLSGAKIVSGGDAYYEGFTTERNVMGESMFQECTKLRAMVLPAEVTIIGSKAFSGSGLKEIDIPRSVVSIGFDAFAYCSSLQKVVVGSKVTTLNQGVFYSSPVKTVYMKPMVPPNTPPYLFSSSPKIYVYTDVVSDYRQANWGQYGSVVAGLEDYYPIEKDSIDIANDGMGTYFEDASCSELKAAYKAMSDDELKAAFSEGGMPQFMTELALKIKNEKWAKYEKDFRIHSYNAYSDATYWNNKMKSTGGSYMGNPTGIYATEYEQLYVYVDSDVPADATLYIAGCVGNDLITNATAGKKLKKGLTVIDGQKDALYYILYTADTKSQTKTLSEWPDIKIHIEGGKVNGYYDLARHSDADYKAILKAATHERFTVKGGQALFNFKTASYRKVWPSSIDKSITWFDSLTVWEKELMGMCVTVASGQKAEAPFYLSGGEGIFPIYYNNPNFAIEGEEADAGWANSTPYRTSYNSQACIKSSFDVNNPDHDEWCSAHECGHNNQGAINLEGGTEVSNNLFSNYIRYHSGIATSSGSPLAVTMNYYAMHTPYFIRSVDCQLRMYYQLFLYYHLAQKNTSFYPELFKALRDDPLTVWKNSNNSSLKFVRKVCEVAQEDLTDFFAAWGFFEPFNNLHIEDYGAHTMTVRKTDINRTLEEIAKYPKKNREILFIEDRVDYVLTNGFLTTAGKKRRGSDVVGQCGSLGQFTDYLPGACQPSHYTYLQSDSLYALQGSGGLGFLMLDDEGKMVFAANDRNICIPTCIGDDFSIYSVDADGSLHEVEYEGSGTEEVFLDTAGSLSDSLSENAIKAIIGGPVNGTDIKYMRQLISDKNLASIDLSQARIMSGGSAYYSSYRSALNTIGDYAFYGFRKLVAIQLPQTLTKIGSNAFARSGLKEVWIPNTVTTIGGDAFAYCEQLTRVVIGSKVKTMSQGVFYSSPVKEAYVFALTPPSVTSYLFSSNPVIHVYSRSLAAYKASKWAEFGTIVGDLEDYTDITSVKPEEDILPSTAVSDAPIYDLFGRRVINPEPGVIYIQNRRKFIAQ